MVGRFMGGCWWLWMVIEVWKGGVFEMEMDEVVCGDGWVRNWRVFGVVFGWCCFMVLRVGWVFEVDGEMVFSCFRVWMVVVVGWLRWFRVMVCSWVEVKWVCRSGFRVGCSGWLLGMELWRVVMRVEVFLLMRSSVVMMACEMVSM